MRGEIIITEEELKYARLGLQELQYQKVHGFFKDSVLPVGFEWYASKRIGDNYHYKWVTFPDLHFTLNYLATLQKWGWKLNTPLSAWEYKLKTKQLLNK